MSRDNDILSTSYVQTINENNYGGARVISTPNQTPLNTYSRHNLNFNTQSLSSQRCAQKKNVSSFLLDYKPLCGSLNYYE